MELKGHEFCDEEAHNLDNCAGISEDHTESVVKPEQATNLCDIPADILCNILEIAGLPWNLLACRASQRLKSISASKIENVVVLDLSTPTWYKNSYKCFVCLKVTRK
jgi:hypothetical protein